ncbi:restriction endonuclease subunit S [Dyella sp. 2RAF44]|uniref:restriction endonuclease subunit S n=1 Tax=Dyella sp. 2RAF44 TaxID=3233000 RepID=UPI003F8E8A9A
MTAAASLPPSWLECTLGDVVNYGSTRKAEPNEIPDSAWILELEDIEKDTSKVLQRMSFAERQSKSTKNQFSQGDVLYGKLRPYLNKVVRASEAGYCTTEIVPLTPPEQLNGDYLFYWLKHPRFLEYVTSVSHGLSMPRLGTDAGRAAPFILAPLPEQKRIAEKLDRLLLQVDACRGRLDRIPEVIRRFRQSVLAAATSGELTREWRETHSEMVDASPLAREVEAAHEAAGGHKVGNAAPPTEGVHDLSIGLFPQGWSLLTLRDLVQPNRPITYGILKPGPELEEGVPYVRVADFPNDQLNLNTIRKTSATMDEQFRRSRLECGDVLLSIRGTVGRLVVVPPELEGANITQDTARLTLQPAVNSEFVLWALRSELLQRRMKGAIKGVAVRGINIGDVRALQVPLPSRAEQDEITRRIGELIGSADLLLERVRNAQRHIDRLTASTLAKAFRGELVPQDPADEPASELLARLSLQQSDVDNSKRPKKEVARKAFRAPKENSRMTKSRQDEDVKGEPYLARHLKALGGSATVEALFATSELPVADFYKQLAWEVDQGLVRDNQIMLEASDAA